MSRPLPPLNALRAFEAIARHLSFAKAAEELHVTPAALSHQIRGLEEQLGLALFHRRTRAIELTDAGSPALPGPACWIRKRARRGRTARPRARGPGARHQRNAGLTAKWLVPRLWRFMAAHPDIDARISASLRYADFVADDVDVAIRLSNGVHSDLHVERLFEDFGAAGVQPAAGGKRAEATRDLSTLHADPLRYPALRTVSAAVGRLAEGRPAFRASTRRAGCASMWPITRSMRLSPEQASRYPTSSSRPTTCAQGDW